MTRRQLKKKLGWLISHNARVARYEKGRADNLRLKLNYQRAMFESIDEEAKKQGEAEYKKLYSQAFANSMCENIEIKKRWAALRDIFQITIDNYEDDPRYYYDVMTAKSVIEEMDKLESEG